MTEKIVIKVKKTRTDAIIPTKAHDTDIGFDVYALDLGNMIFKGERVNYIEYDTGIAVEPPEGYYIECYARSSITNKDLILKNSVGIIDPDFRNSIKFRYYATNGTCDTNIYRKGERIGQLIVRKIVPAVLLEVDTLSNTERGLGGLGSTGA